MRTRFRGFEPPSPQAVSPKKEPWPSPLTLCDPSQTTLGICQRGVGSFATKTELRISARGSRFAYAAQPPQVMAGGTGGSGFYRLPVEETAAHISQRSYGFGWFSVRRRRRSVGAIDDARGSATKAEQRPQSHIWRFACGFCQLGVLS